MRKLLCVLALVAWGVIGAQPASAAIWTLTDDNSTARINDEAAFFDGNDFVERGMYDWEVDGVDQLFQQWFWFRIGDQGPEASIDTLAIDVAGVTDTNFSGDDNNFFVRYLGAGFEIEVNFLLLGGAAGTSASDVSEVITINNTGGQALDFHFFQYSDFDLDNQISGQTVTLINANTVRQTGGGFTLSETVVTPQPDLHEVNTFANTIISLEDTDPTTLNGDGGPVFGDATWAFQWDFTLGVGGTMQISKDKNLRQIPEPSAIVIWSVFGLVGLAFARYRRKR